MGKKVRTYKGNMVDFDELMTKNQESMAVGNMPVNARGDVLDEHGKVVKTRDQVTKEYYKGNTKSVVKSTLLDDIDEELPELKDDPNVVNKKKSSQTKTSSTKQESKEEDKSDSKESNDSDSKTDDKE